MKKKRFVLIDANSLVHRAYHAYPSHLSTKEGVQTNAVYGFSLLLLKIIKDLEPDLLVCAFDVKGKTFRHKMYKDYKATRKEYEKELLDQFPLIKEVVGAFDIPIVEKEGVEADDVIGTLQNDMRVKKLEKIIVSGDRDMFQLVDSDTKVYLSGRNFSDSKLYGEKEVARKIGIRPSQVLDYKAIYGDSSDNIPGVSGVGEKGAIKLVQEYGNLDNIYKNLDDIEARYKSKLASGKKYAYLSKELARIIDDVPLKYDFAKFKWGEFDIKQVHEIFHKYGFRSLLKSLEKFQKPETKKISQNNASEIDIRDVSDGKNLKSFRSDLKKASHMVFYADTNGESINSVMTSLAICFRRGRIYLFKQSVIDKEKELIRKIFENKICKKGGYDLKHSMQALKNLDIDLKEPYTDVQIEAYLLQEGSGGISLGDLAFNYLGQDLHEKQEQQIGMMDEVSGESLASRVDSIHALHDLFKKKLDSCSKSNCKNLDSLFKNIEMPLVKVLFGMELKGILVDCEFLNKFSGKLEQEIKEVEKEAFRVVGHEFNLNSPGQVSEVLFEELDLPKSKRTKGGKYSTGAGILESLRGIHPVIEQILRFRELSKLNSTYTAPLVESVDPETKRIHTTFSQVVATTGRLSSSNPNLQNIPISTDLGKEVRKAFVAPEGSSLISFDYSQQELRILAHLAREKNLIKAFKNDIDVHKLTASKLFDKDIEKVKKQERRIAKTINFAVMYGMGARGLSGSLGISFEQADEFIAKYFEEYSSVKSFFDRYLEEAKERGYAVTMFGRRRPASGLSASNMAYRKATEREIINFPIQGSAADMMKKAMIEVAKLIKKKYEDTASLILQIHDELVFEYKGKKNLEAFKKDVALAMSKACPIDVPVKVEACEGKNLYEIH